MSTLEFRDALMRGGALRRVLTVLAVLMGLATAVHHSGLADADMASMDSGHAMSAGMCVGIAIASVGVEGLLMIRRVRRRRTTQRRPPARRLLPVSLLAPSAWAPAARDGPNLHLSLCVDRR